MMGQIFMVRMFKTFSLFFILTSTMLEARTQVPFAFSYKPGIVTITDYGTYKGWSNGTYASTCDAYRNPTVGFSYTGSTGDGVYKINLNSSPTNVYCLMSRNGFGYVRVGARYANNNNQPIIDSPYSAVTNYVSSTIMRYYRPAGTAVRFVTYKFITTGGGCTSVSQTGWVPASGEVTTTNNPWGTFTSATASLGTITGSAINETTTVLNTASLPSSMMATAALAGVNNGLYLSSDYINCNLNLGTSDGYLCVTDYFGTFTKCHIGDYFYVYAR